MTEQPPRAGPTKQNPTNHPSLPDGFGAAVHRRAPATENPIRPDQPFQQQMPRATARPEQERGYGHLTTPLRQRGLVCTVEYGLSDYIVHAELPDGSALIISPPQEPSSTHPPGRPHSWLVTRGHPDDSSGHEVIYNSETGGPHARHRGDAVTLLAAIDARLDELGLPPRPEPGHPVRRNAKNPAALRTTVAPGRGSTSAARIR
jgi:hypothetical protein